MSRDQQYEDTKLAVAKLIARERGEDLKVTHYNDAAKALWQVLNDDTRGALIFR